MKKKRSWNSGNTTLEYAILLPLIFAIVFSVILVFLVLYQKALLQELAEDTAESLSRQWNYGSLTEEELGNGVFTRKGFEEREIYWSLKVWNNGKKEDRTENLMESKVKGIGPLKAYEDAESGKDQNNRIPDNGVLVAVDYQPGVPATISVRLKTACKVPGAGLMKLVGLDGLLTIEGRAQAQVFDAKELIQTSDYVLQLLRKTKSYQLFMEKTAPVKDNLDKLLKR